MDEAMVQRHLNMAREHIILGEQHIARQRLILARLAERGSNSAEAERLLVNFQESQVMHVAHRDRLEAELLAMKGHDDSRSLVP